MAGSLSDYGEKKALDYLLVTNAGKVGLFTAMPGENTAGTEVSGNGYARQDVTYGASSVVSGQTVSVNTNTPTFTAAGGAWGTIVGYAVFDKTDLNSVIYYATLEDQKTIGDGDSLGLPPGKLKLYFD